MAAAVRTTNMGPLKRMNLASQVMDRVKEYIAENNLRPGARLPSEKELIQTLGVSRNVLREALKSLETVGLIKIRVGDGMYVSGMDYSLLADHVSFAIARDQRELRKVAEARDVLDLCSLKLAVDRLDDEEIERLEECVRRLQCAGSEAEKSEADRNLHLELRRIAANPILNEFGSLLDRLAAANGDGGTPLSSSSSEDVQAQLVEVLRASRRK